ncbi:MAG: membrane integrity-associated transporter subunit PqiC [Halioglobus sp.]|nr:membrane integrity-associated transporter subunit PqiC [Halioglobus sp.]
MMKVAGLFLVVLLSACASQPLPTTYYLLRSGQDLQSTALSTSTQYSLGSVEIAAYLDQPGLVMATGNGEMHAASQNLWAEPIYDGVRNFLATEIAQATGQQLLPAKLARGTTVLNIRIDQLHGTQDGQALIVAYWWLVDGDEVASLNRFSESRALAASGYSALVDAEKILLTDLATSIATALENRTPKSAVE